MNNLKLVRKLGWETVRRYCISRNLYTRGCNEEYESLYEYIAEKNYIISDEDLLVIANDILVHSDTDLLIENIFSGLNRESYYELEEEI